MIKRKQYTTDLGDVAGQIVESFFEEVEGEQKRGRKRSHELRELINATRYVLKNGCTWRDLPGDFSRLKIRKH
jgi:putative transposase